MVRALVRAVAADGASLVPVQHFFRQCIGLSISRHLTKGDKTSYCGRNWLSGDTSVGKGGVFSQDIADLNAEIAGFVGDLGDPDFDTTPTVGSRGSTQRSKHGQAAPVKAGGSIMQPNDTSTEQHSLESNCAGQARRRLTLADHPSAAGSTSGTFDVFTKTTDWSTSSTAVGNQARGMKSVLVLNGAACFIGEKLATTGESRESIMRAIEAAAKGFDLALTVCTSNSERELLDRVCEGGYNAIVYNPSGFGHGSGVLAQQSTNGTPSTASDVDAIGYTELDHNGDAINRHPTSRSGFLPLRPAWVRSPSGTGRVLEYGLVHAGCPVVIISPRSDSGREPNGPRQLGEGVISGFSGVLSYRLAISAVAALLDEKR